MARIDETVHDVKQEPGAFSDAMDALWRQFGTATTSEMFCSTWLALQCRMIPGVTGGVVLLGAPEENRPFAPVAFWPDKQRNLKHLSEAAERALNERRGVVLKRQSQADGAPRPRCDIAYPVQSKGRTYGVVALDIEARSDEALRDVMRQLQWGSAWMEVLFQRGQSNKAAAPQDRLQAIVTVFATLVSQEKFRGAAVAVVTTLAKRFDCDRVSLGFIRRKNIRVEALSHSAQFGKDTNLIRAIGEAMDEAADQRAVIVYPELPDSGALVARAHSDLVREAGNGAVCSIPFSREKEVVGVITLERPAGLVFDRETVELCESVCALVGPVLEVQRREDRWLLRKVYDSCRNLLGSLIGPRHVGLKLGVVAILALAVFFVKAEGDYRVTAQTVIEPATRQAVVAGLNGYIRSAPHRAGDEVARGTLLAKLDDRELKLEHSKWQSQEQQSTRQYHEALGNRNAAQVQILTAQIAQAKAQVALLDDQLARTEITAPFDGIIVTGDLSHSLGSPVERGQVLFELAPLDSYRIILQVDERDIGDVAVEQRGQLVLSGFADDPLPFSVGRLTPVSTASEGRNFFRVEAHIENPPERLRPGMEGVGKIEIDRRRLVWIWTHEVIDWVRLKVWNWLP
jgi:RND family efflux transporter MFP subunit